MIRPHQSQPSPASEYASSPPVLSPPCDDLATAAPSSLTEVMKWAAHRHRAGFGKEAPEPAPFVSTVESSAKRELNAAAPATTAASARERSKYPDSEDLTPSTATGRSIAQADAARCAFVDWDLTSSRFYTVLGELLEQKITRLLTK